MRNTSRDIDQLSRTTIYTTLKEGSNDRKMGSFFEVDENLRRFAGGLGGA